MHVSGVELTLKGFSSYIKQLSQLDQRYTGTDKAAERLQARVDMLANAVSRSARAVEAARASVNRQASSYAEISKKVAYYREEIDRLASALKSETDLEKRAAIRGEIEQVQERLTAAMSDCTEAAYALASAVDLVMDRKDKATSITTQYTQATSALGARLGDTLGMFGSMITGIEGLSGRVVLVSAAIGGLILGFKALQGVIGLVVGAFNLIRSVATTAINAVVGVVQGAVNVFKGFLGIIERITRPLRNFISGMLQVAGGTLIADKIRQIQQAIGNLVDEVFDAASAFQTLEIQLSALAARDYAQITGESMAVAFEKTSNAAGILFDWLRRLAVATPFGVEEISYTFAMGQAMGLTLTQAKGMTEALINYTSAMGLTDLHMQRIIYNFGQMIQRGRLSGEEMRDLSRNLFPINQILAEMGAGVGKTADQMREFAVEGGVPVTDFLEKFIEIVERDYPGAAEKMSKTIGAVTQNVRDFIKTFIGVDVFKPILDAVADRMKRFLDTLTSDERLMASTKMLGETLLMAFKALTPAVDALVGAIGDLFASFGGGAPEIQRSTKSMQMLNNEVPRAYEWARTLARVILTAVHLITRGLDWLTGKIKSFSGEYENKFDGLINRAKEWGEGFIVAFARGITSGLNILAEVISGITKILTSWFMPTSPPRIVPELDKWAAETMNIWLRGFMNADFDIFEDVSDLAERYLRSISLQIGGEEGELMIPRILEMRTGIAQAIEAVSSGAMTAAQATRSMTAAIGQAQGDFSAYISTLFELAEAERSVVDASEAIEQAQAQIEQAEALFGIANAELAVEQAKQRVKAAQDAVNAVSEKYSGILAELRAQLDDVTDVYEENQRLAEIDEALANERLTEEERIRLENEKRALLIKRQIKEVEAQRDAEMEAAEAIVDSAKAEEDKAQARLDSLEAQVDLYVKQLEVVIEQAKAEEAASKQQLDALKAQADLYERRIDALIENNSLIEDQARLVEKLKEDTEDTVQEMEKILAPELTMEPDTGVWDRIKADLKGINDEAKGAADSLVAFGEDIKSKIDATGIGEAWGAVTEAADGLRKAIATIIGDQGEGGILKKLGDKWVELKKKLGFDEDESMALAAIDAIVDAVTKVSQWWKENRLTIISFGLGVVELARNLAVFAISASKSASSILESWTKIANAFGLVKEGSEAEKAAKTWVVIADMAAAPLLGFALAMRVVATVMDVFSTAVQGTANAIRELSSAMKEGDWAEMGGDVWKSIISQIFSEAAGLGERIGDLWLTGRQFGGPVRAGEPYVVGERRPEVFVPPVSGYVYPSTGAYADMLTGFFGGMTVSAPPVTMAQSIDNSTTVNVNASYKDRESEAGIYYDVVAAMVAARR